jgi:hypothetical protein
MASKIQLREMIERQEYRCAGTGVELQPEWASLDHKMPRSMGGSNDIDNLHIVHETINASKGDMDWVDFVAMCHAVARTHEDTGAEWWMAKARRRLDFQGTSSRGTALAPAAKSTVAD